jgi:hypothetical protein
MFWVQYWFFLFIFFKTFWFSIQDLNHSILEFDSVVVSGLNSHPIDQGSIRRTNQFIFHLSQWFHSIIYLKSPASPQVGKYLWHHLLVKRQSFKFCFLQKPLSSNIYFFFLDREFSVPPVERSTARKYVQAVPEVAPKTSSMTLSSTSPWDSTGFYYSPRYPQSHRGMIYYGIICN